MKPPPLQRQHLRDQRQFLPKDAQVGEEPPEPPDHPQTDWAQGEPGSQQRRGKLFACLPFLKIVK